LVFKLRGEESDDEGEVGPQQPGMNNGEEERNEEDQDRSVPAIPIAEHKITIIDSD